VEKLNEEELDGDDERLVAQRIAACRHWGKFA
jgi:hypothetical protein